MCVFLGLVLGYAVISVKASYITAFFIIYLKLTLVICTLDKTTIIASLVSQYCLAVLPFAPFVEKCGHASHIVFGRCFVRSSKLKEISS